MIQKKLITLFLYIGISTCSTMWGSEQTAEIPKDFDITLQSITAYEDKCTYVNNLLKSCWFDSTLRAPVIRKAIDAGISPNDLELYGNSALYDATTYKQEEIVELLLKHKADPNIDQTNPHRYHQRILFRVMPTPIAKLLLDHNAHFDGFNEEGRTILYELVTQNSPESFDMVLFYVQHGVPLHCKIDKRDYGSFIGWLKIMAPYAPVKMDLLQKIKVVFFERRAAFKAALADSGLPVPVQRLALDYDDIQEFDESEK